ncbi:hypothetical protein GWK47_008474 [Chionoecetes opilio]|uniref:RRM domain-containing protein n=1 Tax=Chionoecetes opilio TaxID=41210 RepID=A0A8J4Y8R8_CHIOP|nr:hypothetical protein GWK47_008474 [Chionoecetes opilio]
MLLYIVEQLPHFCSGFPTFTFHVSLDLTATTYRQSDSDPKQCSSEDTCATHRHLPAVGSHFVVVAGLEAWSTAPPTLAACLPLLGSVAVGLVDQALPLRHWEVEPSDLPRPASLPDVRLSSTSPIESSHIATLAPFQARRGTKRAAAPSSIAPRSGGPRIKGRRQGLRDEPGPRGTSTLDTLLLSNVSQALSYRALHDIFKVYGVVRRIRLIYDDNGQSNRCYINFAAADDASSAYEEATKMEIGARHYRAELIRSVNVGDGPDDYIPNTFEKTTTSTPPVRHSPTPSWYVAYYKESGGNFFLAARYIEKEIGMIPEGNLKRYGRGVLI